MADPPVRPTYVRAAFALVIMATGCAGCASPKNTTDDVGPNEGGGPTGAGACAVEMHLTPGTGADSFVALEPGDPVTMEHGPQGGWHLDLAGRVENSDRDVLLSSSVTVTSLDLQVAGADQEMVIHLDTDPEQPCNGSGEFSGFRTILDDADAPAGATYQEFICSLEGQELDIAMSAEDIRNGRMTMASAVATARLDPDDVPLCD